MGLKLLSVNDLKPDEPLPWDVYDESKRLLLCKGYVVSNAGQFHLLLDRGMYVEAGDYAQAQAGGDLNGDGNPFVLVERTQAKLNSVLFDIVKAKNAGPQVESCAERVRRVVDGDPDVGISRAMLAQETNYAVSHKVSVAIIVQLLVRRLGWSDNEQQQAVCASLTMNVGMLELQNRLYYQHAPLSQAQRDIIRNHSHIGSEALSEAGIVRVDWLKAVRDHHECRTGLGYPQGRSDSSEMAEIIRYTDIYCAKVAGRAYRKAMPPHVAARELFLSQKDDPINAPLIATLIKEIGMYPPGTFVKLANGETGIVTKRGEFANAPQVHGLCDEKGWVFSEPRPRDTKQPQFRILYPIERDNVLVSVPIDKVWGHAT